MMATAETNIAHLIMIAASQHGHRLFKNARGIAFAGPGRNQPVRYGVGPNGASDLIGWTRAGKFAAIEVKTATGKARDEQMAFIDAVRAAGGVAGLARSVDDALAILND